MTTTYPYPRFPDWRPLTDDQRNTLADLAGEGIEDEEDES